MRSNKAVATPEYIGDVMNGRRTTIPLQHRPDPTLPLGLWVQDADQPTCLLRITACQFDGEGWTVEVRPWVYEHTPRLLMPAGRPKGSELGYTDKPYLSMVDEPEAIDLRLLDKGWAETAGRRHGKARLERLDAARQARELLDRETRLANARQAAHANFVSLRDEFRVLRHMQKNGKPAAVVTQVTRIEQIAYREAA